MCQDLSTKYVVFSSLCDLDSKCTETDVGDVVDCLYDYAFLLEYNCYSQGML